ncbi:sensor histidine kinase [Ramlibacter sp.]|uniref:sensor histidine kinase n=1 Tax=Ramlibacter sp. TaxID=1917967 RepID=UPI00180E8C8E|nr:sensor histidine kinase [Ramlibacter sp.]MBA2673500.1 sensor histidine kinase N-terminal domain-containing protein [Ramlibacter sp.]
MTSGLRRRLFVMLIAPLVLLALGNAWMDYRSAGNVAAQQDQRLLALVPLVADSVIGENPREADRPILMLAPPVAEFLADRDKSAYAIVDSDGKVLHGAAWLAGLALTGSEPELHSEEQGGVTWRIARQRQQTVIGDVAIAVADGSDPRQQWARSIILKVLLPNLVLVAAAAFAVRWGVQRALRPLLELKEAVERRSPRDLSAIDAGASPEEVRPLVDSLNRLFGLVNAQAEGQRRFVADAAHQLRTPLAGLQAQVEAWAQAASLSANQTQLTLPSEQIYKLRSATRRTSQLASQLLALSRADARGLQGQPVQRVDLKSLCESALETYLDAATAKRIDLGMDAQPARAMGHEWLLRELLSNLADNAVKYTPEGGTVTLRCGLRQGRAFLEVEDDGPGVPAAERPRVLERFYRVPGTVGEGNGLGLAIAEQIAHAHHSQLQLQPGAGGRGLKITLEFLG